MDEPARDLAILGFDTATPLTTVAVARDRDVVFERTLDPGPGGRPRHATELLGQIGVAVEAARGWQGVGAIAVGVGPGSFTGLRVGIAMARALAGALGKPLLPVGSLAALARGIGEHPAAAGRQRLAVIDARRGEAFAALYGEGGEAIWEPFVAGPRAIVARLGEVDPAPLAAGDGALRFRQELEVAGAEVPGGDDPVHRISAGHVCRLAEGGTPAPPQAVEPMYLRRPDAEIWRERVRDGSAHRA